MSEFFVTLEPAKIIYVSCNPQALTADLEKLQEKYQVQAVQPIDLFPHTPHLEIVVTLKNLRKLSGADWNINIKFA